ncbi:hypothetical protein M0802_000010 [Mischocyttarus mexicanus]|nr:hypothetical protein M0802_000010 [Mischocyttarus mexicanus]
MNYPFSDKRKVYKFWKKVVFSIFSRMVWNAFVLYQKNITEEKSLNITEFISTIIKSLTKEWMKEKRMNPEKPLGETSSDTTDPGIRKLPEKRRKVCVVCSKADDESVQKSRTVCNHCNNGLHDVCISKHQC